MSNRTDSYDAQIDMSIKLKGLLETGRLLEVFLVSKYFIPAERFRETDLNFYHFFHR
jgi:hypothetical protein